MNAVGSPRTLLAVGAALMFSLPLTRGATRRWAGSTEFQVAASQAESATQPAAYRFTSPRVAVELFHDKTLVPVRFDGLRELRLILDTGMGFDGALLFKPALRESIGMRHAVEAQIPGAGSGPPSAAVFSDSMTFNVGSVRFENQRVIVLSGAGMDRGAVDGVIGYSLLGHYAVELNFDSLTLTLHDPQRFASRIGWAELPLSFDANHLPFLETSVIVESGPPVALRTYIDCASSEAIELLERPVMKFVMPRETEEVLLGRGLSGDIHGKRGRIAKLILGPHVLTDVRAAFGPAEVRSKASGADAVLANGALRRFNVVFDYAHSRLLLAPNSHFHERYE